MSKRSQKQSGYVGGHCGLILRFVQWHNGQSLGCKEIDLKLVSYPRRPLQKAVDLFCHVCENNPYTIRRSEQRETKK